MLKHDITMTSAQFAYLHCSCAMDPYLLDHWDGLPVPSKDHSVLLLEHVEVALGDVLHGYRDVIGQDSNQAALFVEGHIVNGEGQSKTDFVCMIKLHDQAA